MQSDDKVICDQIILETLFIHKIMVLYPAKVLLPHAAGAQSNNRPYNVFITNQKIYTPRWSSNHCSSVVCNAHALTSSPLWLRRNNKRKYQQVVAEQAAQRAGKKIKKKIPNKKRWKKKKSNCWREVTNTRTWMSVIWNPPFSPTGIMCRTSATSALSWGLTFLISASI